MPAPRVVDSRRYSYGNDSQHSLNSNSSFDKGKVCFELFSYDSLIPHHERAIINISTFFFIWSLCCSVRAWWKMMTLCTRNHQTVPLTLSNSAVVTRRPSDSRKRLGIFEYLALCVNVFVSIPLRFSFSIPSENDKDGCPFSPLPACCVSYILSWNSCFSLCSSFSRKWVKRDYSIFLRYRHSFPLNILEERDGRRAGKTRKQSGRAEKGKMSMVGTFSRSNLASFQLAFRHQQCDYCSFKKKKRKIDWELRNDTTWYISGQHDRRNCSSSTYAPAKDVRKSLFPLSSAVRDKYGWRFALLILQKQHKR